MKISLVDTTLIMLISVVYTNFLLKAVTFMQNKYFYQEQSY
jgi:hypothetical protein